MNPHYIDNSNSRQVLNEIIGGLEKKGVETEEITKTYESKTFENEKLICDKTQQLQYLNEMVGGKVGVYTKVFQSIKKEETS